MSVGTTVSPDGLLLLQLALWNNQGLVLLALGHAREAQRTCFQPVLWHRRTGTGPYSDSSTIQQPAHNFSFFEQFHIREFLRNAFGGECVASSGTNSSSSVGGSHAAARPNELHNYQAFAIAM